MRTSTRLILTLTLLVGAIMAVAGYVLVRRQEASLLEQRRNEVLAHATSLQIALDTAYGAGRPDEANVLIDRLSQNAKIVGVVLYDDQGHVSGRSDPAVPSEAGASAEIQRVIATGEAVERIRQIDGRDVFSMSMPLDLGNGRRGGFEIIEVTTFVKADIRQARLTFALTTLLLFLSISLAVFLVTRRYLSRPVRSLLAGARAYSLGDFEHRVSVPPGSNEFAELALEFNRMADRLDEQRCDAAREAEERISLEREVRHNERLAAVGRLAAGVAHEMGAPLNVIDGRAKQLLSRPDTPLDVRQRNLTIIRTQTQRIARIVRQLLGLARPYELRLAPADLVEIARSACDMFETEASAAGVAVELHADQPLPIVVDESLVQQVLVNVLLNGLQSMPDGGTLSVEISDLTESRLAVVKVSDTGPGILDEHLSQVFDPFFTTKEFGRGTGLGLSVSRRIVEEHGGMIEAGNRAGGGAVFTVYLPKRVAHATEGASPHEDALARS